MRDQCEICGEFIDSSLQLTSKVQTCSLSVETTESLCLHCTEMLHEWIDDQKALFSTAKEAFDAFA